MGFRTQVLDVHNTHAARQAGREVNMMDTPHGHTKHGLTKHEHPPHELTQHGPTPDVHTPHRLTCLP